MSNIFVIFFRRNTAQHGPAKKYVKYIMILGTKLYPKFLLTAVVHDVLKNEDNQITVK